jgi:hypothetical protein
VLGVRTSDMIELSKIIVEKGDHVTAGVKVRSVLFGVTMTLSDIA